MSVLPDWQIQRDIVIEPFAEAASRPGMISYGVSTLGEESTITKTYGMDINAVVSKLGLGENGRVNKVRLLPTRWFYE